jgi:hypothetical protein
MIFLRMMLATSPGAKLSKGTPVKGSDYHVYCVRAVIGIILLATAAAAPGQSPNPTAKSNQSIVKRLMPNGGVHPLLLPSLEQKGHVVRQLQRMQNDVSHPDAQQVAFLLAVLDVNYVQNRDYLVWVLKGCNVPEVTHGCDDMTGEFLAYLYDHGHSEVLTPLMKYGNSYNAAGSEFVGTFLSETVAKSPDNFLDAVRSFPVPTQKKICYFAGLADGGGMAPANLRLVRKVLAARPDDVTARCLREIENANKSK